MLTKIILLYFLIPNLIFFLSYYKIYVSIPILFCLLFFFYKTKNLNIKIKFNKKFFLGLILIIGWTSISGIFPQIYQNGDWFKHNSILYDLVEKKWPVSYGNNNLIYYIGYYLPAALLGKIFSLKISKLFLALWTLIGMVLIYILLTEKITKKINRSILFIMFGGLNFLIYFIKNKLNIAGTDQNWYTTVEWMYLPNSTALFQNTQQAIYGWLATLLLFREYKETKTVDLLPYIFTLSLIISPFISLGLIIFLPIYFSEIKKIIHRINPKKIKNKTKLTIFFSTQIIF